MRISARAQGDLDCIYAYFLIHHGDQAADQFLDQAGQAAEFLAK